jgi:serine/threonine protein kinase
MRCSLEDVMTRGSLHQEQVARYLAQACSGLRYLHELGILHK